MKLIAVAVTILSFAGITACGKDKGTNNSGAAEEAKEVAVSLDVSKTYQTIDNFGASDAWSCQFVGNWPDAKRNAIADLLFSRRLKADGSPEGIGLSIWRFNIGAGSAQQGDQSGIKDEWRRAESFLESNGNYNWNLQAGQLWFLKAAKERGVEQFLAFTNSPPVQLTTTQKAYANGARPNLSLDKFSDFANFLTSVVKGVADKTGVLFNYISPVNEPQWDWSDGGQEGTPFTNTDIAGIVKALDASITSKNLGTKVIVTEAGQFDYLYSDNGKAAQGNQINALFNPTSSTYIGNLNSVQKLICAHSYFTTSPFAKAVSVRNQVAAKTASVDGLSFWQSEYCILGDNDGEIKGEGRDLGIAPALYLARVIHNDLVHANASAWQWWLAISPYDYKDGLIYVDKNKTDGTFYPSKMLWALGNYSRFISPGSKRISVSINGASEPELLVSSYLTPDNKVVTVAVNSAIKTLKLKLQLSGRQVQNTVSYTTSSGKELVVNPSLQTENINLEPSSITTFVSDLK